MAMDNTTETGEEFSYQTTAPIDPKEEGATDSRRAGHCKWFNVIKGWGFITPDDGGQDVFVHQSVLQMDGFRSLGQNEPVEFECKLTDKGYEATRVFGPSQTQCKGSEFRPRAKRKYRKMRCYNCGEFANHIAQMCAQGPLPKRCHHCKSEDHLVVDCPNKPPPKVQQPDQHQHQQHPQQQQHSSSTHHQT
ncbi:protein lin-28 homolog isoform X1 [Culex quinquefasciatus]|uniref:protein lin-28 homolog isoform X1 n=1 Tax=Culex quinquefasciatus TaxID=7176 RepID=UPI0018E359A2|nr:protein lin-28 homolog isoform X1 [Culex quinquefasciatus]